MRERPVEVMLRDPLGEVARKERRSLLGISIIAIFVGWSGVVPHDLTTLGLKFEAPAHAVLLRLFVWVVGYYTVAFAVYAWNDFLSWVYAMYVGSQELKKLRDGQPANSSTAFPTPKPSSDTPWSLISLVTPTLVVRGLFDFIVPLIVAGAAMWYLSGAVPQVATTTQPLPPSAPTAPAVAPSAPQGTAPNLKAPPPVKK